MWRRDPPDGPHIPNDFAWNCFKRVRDLGPLPWHEEHQRADTGITPSEYDAIRRLLKEGRLETDFDDKFDMVIRAPMVGPPAPPKAKVISNDDGSPGYLETPAILALRERRRSLGR
jgi:hypothetical protein